jgi:hypothetical protein
MDEAMKTTLSSTVDANGVITIDRLDYASLQDDYVTHHQRHILDTMDQMVIKRLVELGWTPPGGAKPCPVDEWMKERGNYPYPW